MTDAPKRIPWQDRPESARRIKRRYRAEKRFKMYGLGAILIALAMLAILLVSIVGKGYPAFVSTKVAVELYIQILFLLT